MFTRISAQPRIYAAMTALLAAAALALFPALTAAAADEDIAGLTATATQARADANAAHDAAASADLNASSAASTASQLRAEADAACAAVPAAVDALALTPDDAVAQAAVASAQSACDSAAGAAGAAESAAADAASAAASAHATADTLEQLAAAAEAALAAAQPAAEEAPEPAALTSDDPPATDEPGDEPTTECPPPSGEEPSDDSAGEPSGESTGEPTDSTEGTPGDTEGVEGPAQSEDDQTVADDGCGEASIEGFSADRRQNNCDRDMNFFSQNRDWDWCFPSPKIDIDVESLCPTVISVDISHLWPWVEYTVLVNGVNQPITIDENGHASFTVNDFGTGKFEVKVFKGEKKLAYEHEWVSDKGCPTISTEVQECSTIDGSGTAWVYVNDLQVWRTYTIEIVGPDGFSYTEDVSGVSYWSDYFSLAPGSYTVTVSSDGGKHKADIGPVYGYFDLAPCPANITITINPTCSSAGSGSLGATLSGLVTGREYWVTDVGTNGTVTDVTYVATGPTWEVPPAHLPPGTYTVTVVDTASSSSGADEALAIVEPEYDPLSWTATGTITSCPALASTGSSPAGQLLPALGLIPLGAGLLLVSAMRRRKARGELDAVEQN